MKRLNIFLLATDHLVTEHYRQFLTMQGYQNVTVFDTEAVCTAHLDEQPDIVFLGNVTEPTGALEILRNIKSFNPVIDVVLLPGAEYASALPTSRRGDFVLDYLVSILDRVNVVKKFIKRDPQLVY